ncbi:hypothetical protein ACNI3Q_08910 [Sphingomonas sp. FW199]|uniref:hypothetical protein n=1 Tax=Sphingomonas sp. FW199 TaxID=3400217 RepID=UPI003CF9D3F9
MSRSRKKTPIIGFTCAKSDEPWKAKAARRFRQAAKQALAGDDGEALLPERRWAEVNPWDAPKDGKQWVGGGPARWLWK